MEFLPEEAEENLLPKELFYYMKCQRKYSDISKIEDKLQVYHSPWEINLWCLVICIESLFMPG